MKYWMSLILTALFAAMSVPVFGQTMPDSLAWAASKEACATYAMDKIAKFSASIYSPGMINAPDDMQTLYGVNLSANPLDTLKLLRNAGALQVEIADPTKDEVYSWVGLYSADNEILFSGGGGGKLVESNGVWALSAGFFAFDMWLASEIKIPVAGLEQARLLIRDADNGRVIDEIWFEVQDGVITWRTYYSGTVGGHLELTYDDRVDVWDIEDRSAANTAIVSGTPNVKIAGLEELSLNQAAVSMVAESYGVYYGTPPQFYLETTGAHWINITVSTTDGERPTGFLVREVKGGAWQPLVEAVGNSTWVPIPKAGYWYVVPIWKKYGKPRHYQDW